jgi:hypothetical protein
MLHSQGSVCQVTKAKRIKTGLPNRQTSNCTLPQPARSAAGLRKSHLPAFPGSYTVAATRKCGSAVVFAVPARLNGEKDVLQYAPSGEGAAMTWSLKGEA